MFFFIHILIVKVMCSDSCCLKLVSPLSRLISIDPTEVGVPWGEPPGRFWGKGCEDLEGFKGEEWLDGWLDGSNKEQH